MANRKSHLTDEEKARFKERYMELTSTYIDCLLDADVVKCTELMQEMADLIPNEILADLNDAFVDNEEVVNANIEAYAMDIDERLCDFDKLYGDIEDE